ncbi:MAG: ABC transporter substrate-binding protein [Actinobacteria bacterium]|nr:ABC transporter substrate-binding protein [Actinomycetota bacterium]
MKSLRESRLVPFLALVLLLSFTLFGCAKTETKPPATQGSGETKPMEKTTTIRIASPTEPSTLDVQKENDGNMRVVTENLFEGLLAMNGRTLKPEPALATEFKRIDDKTWRFTIREGVKWHNGDPFTVDDVVFSVKRQIDPNLKSNIYSFFASINDVKKVDDKTVDVITKGADPIMPTRMTLLKMISSKFAQANPGKIASEAIGTGPYKMKEWKRGVSITIEANDQYWGPKPAIKSATYRFIQEDSTRLSALKAGEVDLATMMLPEYANQMPKVKAVEGLEFGMVRMNARKGVMKDKRLRLAANYAIDKESLAKNLFQGYAAVAPGQVFKPGYMGFNPNLKAYPYDPEKAKALLKEAGYKGEKVQFVGARGRWLKDAEEEETLADMLRAAGFNVELKLVAFSEWLKIYFDQEKTPDLMYTSHSNDIFDADRTFTNYVYTKGSASAYGNPDLDKKIEGARFELDLKKREQTYLEIGDLIYEDPPFIPLVNNKDVYGLAKNLEWEPRQDGRILVSEMKFQ